MQTLLTQTFCLMCNMQELYIQENSIGDAGISALASAITPTSKGGSGALASLKELSLYQNQIGDAGISALASACAGGALAQLRTLYLNDNSISDRFKDTMRTAMSKSGGSVHF